MKTRLLTIFLLLSTLMFCTMCYAMEFQQPVNIGWYSNSRAGGPSKAVAQGYTSATSNTFTFGTGAHALTFKYKNNYGSMGGTSSSTQAVYIGKQAVPIKCYGYPDIYRINSTEGDVFYLGVGVMAGPHQVFALMGKCGSQGYINAITMNNLTQYIKNLPYLDIPDARVLLEPYCQGNQIILPYTVRETNKTGRFVFTWDSRAKWFGISLIE